MATWYLKNPRGSLGFESNSIYYHCVTLGNLFNLSELDCNYQKGSYFNFQA